MTRRLNCEADQTGKSVWLTLSSDDNSKTSVAGEFSDFSVQEKRRSECCINPYRQPTPVGKSSRLRRAGEPFLRNSAKQLGVS